MYVLNNIIIFDSEYYIIWVNNFTTLKIQAKGARGGPVFFQNHQLEMT
jgi:hypothetical protein